MGDALDTGAGTGYGLRRLVLVVSTAVLFSEAMITVYVWVFRSEMPPHELLLYNAPLLLLLPSAFFMFAYLRLRDRTALPAEDAEGGEAALNPVLDLAGQSMSEAVLSAIADGISIQDRSFRVLYQNQAHKDFIGDHVGEFCYRAYKRKKQVCEGCPLARSFADGRTHREEREVRTPQGTKYFEITTSPFRDALGRITSGIEVVKEVTGRRCAEENLKAHLERLRAQRAIDAAITASMDIRFILNVFIEQATAQLGADAADVLLMKNNDMTLEYAAGKGFETDAIRDATVKVGENGAGRVALEKRPLRVPYISDSAEEHSRFSTLRKEGFVTYHCMPLVSKGQLNGVFEVYHRTPFEVDRDWLEFLDSLAVQASIAIDNATLFNNLQTSHDNLVMAYDSTIEGWSRALDFRDRQTQGHSTRVMELAVEIARAMGMVQGELVHMRRGALLHDIGKLGVPDDILLKPGKLDENEWSLMKKHPDIAYELLSPIGYLGPALDIPYCHHEKWDGTGYPRGLVGEDIPLAGRIFAVVDVWDALRSDRPYRPAWPEEKVLEYIRAMAGAHFDPKVVEVFLGIVKSRVENPDSSY